jgi:hypothetical protein
VGGCAGGSLGCCVGGCVQHMMRVKEEGHVIPHLEGQIMEENRRLIQI